MSRMRVPNEEGTGAVRKLLSHLTELPQVVRVDISTPKDWQFTIGGNHAQSCSCIRLDISREIPPWYTTPCRAPYFIVMVVYKIVDDKFLREAKAHSKQPATFPWVTCADQRQL